MRGLIATFILCLGLIAGARAEQNDGISEFYAGHAALQQGDAQTAITHFSKALQVGKLDPTQIAYIHYYRAIAYQRIERHQDAIDGYTQALSYNVLPQRVQAALYYNRAIGLDHLANFERAIKDYSSAIALKPDYAEAYMNRGNAYRKLGDSDQALRDYAASASYGNPIKHLPYYGEGLVYEAKGDKENAFKAFQTALALDPTFQPARLKVEGYQAAGMTPMAGTTVASASGTIPLRTATSQPVQTAMNGGIGASGTTGATAFTGMGATPVTSTPSTKPVGTSGAIAQTLAPAPRPAASTGWDNPGMPGKPATAKPVTTATATPPSAYPVTPQQTASLSAPTPLAPPHPTSAVAPQAPVAGSSVVPMSTTAQAVPAVGGATSGVPQSITPIQVASAQPAPSAPIPTAPASMPKPSNGFGTGGFLIQVAAYKDEAVAQSTAAEVKTKAGDLLADTTGNIQRADLGEKGVYYRIQYGPFPSRAVATERCSGLKSRGLACIIVAPAHS